MGLQRFVQKQLRARGFDIVRYRESPPGVLADEGAIVQTSYESTPARFFVLNRLDHIQREHLAGLFYEREELALIKQHFRGGTFVDVGSNVGNHLLYACLVLGAERAIAFEPNPHARTILNINIALNDLQDRVTVHGVGLADRDTRASVNEPINNLGAARLVEGGEGGIVVRRGDDLLQGVTASFIKMDVEGFELRALAGLKNTILRDRPALFVEVDNSNIPAFQALLDEWGYAIAETVRRYEENVNYLALPRP